MRTLIALLISIGSQHLLASPAIVSIGLLKYCDKHIETQSPREQAFRIELDQVQLNNFVVISDLKLSYFECKQFSSNPDKFGFFLNSPFRQTIYLASDKKTSVTLTPLKRQLIAYVDGVYDIIASASLNSNSQQSLTLKLNLEDILSTDDLKKFKSGKTVSAQIDFSLYSLIQTEFDGQTSQAEEGSSGSYRLHLKIKSGAIQKANLSHSLK